MENGSRLASVSRGMMEHSSRRDLMLLSYQRGVFEMIPTIIQRIEPL